MSQAPLLDLVMTRQLAAAVRALHSPRTFDLGPAGIPASSTVCAECRQTWPCAVATRRMTGSGSLDEPSSKHYGQPESTATERAQP